MKKRRTVAAALAACVVAGALLLGACPSPAGSDTSKPGPDYISALAQKIELAEFRLAGYAASAAGDGTDVLPGQFWLPGTDRAALSDAITAAKAVRDNPDAQAAQRKQAIDDLSAAIDAAEAAKLPGTRDIDADDLLALISAVRDKLETVRQSATGTDIPAAEKWISPENYAALEAAVASAEAALANLASTQTDIDNALNDLTAAYTNYYTPQNGTSAVDKTALNAKIGEARAALSGVETSADGSDVPSTAQWVSAAAYTALADALASAEATAALQDADAGAVQTALQALSAALANFAPAPGTGAVRPEFVSARTVNDPADEFTYTLELTLSRSVSAGAGNAKNGFTVTLDETGAVIESAAISGALVTITLHENYPVKPGAAIAVTYAAASGSLLDAENTAAAAASFAGKAVSNNLAVLAAPVKPWLKTAAVNAGSPAAIDLVFSEPVTIDPAKLAAFAVKVNDQPAVRIGTFSGNTDPLLDKSKRADRTVSAAAAASSGKKYDTAWSLTASASAGYGEILRLALDDAAAVTDRGGNAAMGTMKEFIVRNTLPRSGPLAFTGAAGLYKNGALVGDVAADGDLYQNAIAWIAIAANQTNGAVYTIVLGQDQAYAGAETFTAAQSPDTIAADAAVTAGETVYPAASFTIVLASADAGEKVITVSGTTGSALVIRNGITLIIDQKVAIEHANQGNVANTATNAALIHIKDGGKLILDGGEIRKNYNNSGGPGAGGILLNPDDETSVSTSPAGGEAYCIINSGKVSGNVIKGGNHLFAGGIALMNKAYLVMHGGEVSGNSMRFTSTSGNPYSYSGGIAGFGAARNSSGNAPRSRAGMQALYITGGAVSGNSLVKDGGTLDPWQSAGGISLNGTLQKTGGTIGSNTNEWTGTANHSGIVVQFAMPSPASAANAASSVYYHDAEAGEDVPLFINCVKDASPQANTAPSSTKPAFVPDNWEN